MISDVQSGATDREEALDSTLEKSASQDPIAHEVELGRIVHMLFDGILIIRDGVIIQTNQGLLNFIKVEARTGLRRIDEPAEDLLKTWDVCFSSSSVSQ